MSSKKVDVRKLYKEVMGKDIVELVQDSMTAREYSDELGLSVTSTFGFIRKALKAKKMKKVRKVVDGRSVASYVEI